MRQQHGFIFTFLIALFLTHIVIGKTSDSNSDAPLKPGTASGKLKVNNHAFLIKHAYAKKSKDDTDKTSFLVLLTNRPFPEDLSKLDRLDLNRFAQRYDLQGVVIRVDEKQRLLFTDILRHMTITGAVEFEPTTNEQGLIEGRLHTNGEKQFFKETFELDINFSAKP